MEIILEEFTNESVEAQNSTAGNNEEGETMPKIERPNHLIKSDTKYLVMTAFRNGPVERTDREWYLTFNVSGSHLEFVIAEGMECYMVTHEEAVTRIIEFEKCMKAANRDYVQNLFINTIKIMENMNEF